MSGTRPLPQSSSPDISDIPTAAQLQLELATVQQAIDALNAGGTVNYLTVNPAEPPPPPGTPPGYASPSAMQIRVTLNPEISDPTTITAVVTGLQTQADTLTQQLTDMGYTNNPPPPPPPRRIAGSVINPPPMATRR
jgi:hypothetical protein